MRLNMASAVFVLLGLAAGAASAQIIGPLGPPPVPQDNPITLDKVNLGKALFWDEQLSSTRLTACATCHQVSEGGGADPRSIVGDIRATNPGPDHLYWTEDDITASPGVPLTKSDGTYLRSMYDFRPQVGRRRAPSVINSAYLKEMFLDGRAGGTFRDPITHQIVLSENAALESQASEPVVGLLEMGHAGRDWSNAASRIAASQPLALAINIPGPLRRWINGRSYPALFQQAYGSPSVTPNRIIMAIATYERTLVSDQAPIDEVFKGNFDALNPEEQHGWIVFNRFGCIHCHSGQRLTNDSFEYIGVRPPNDDIGRMEVTGLEEDRGKFRTPSLRNVELRAPYFHNGQYSTLEQVVEFYDLGGEFDAPNKSPLIQPIGLVEEEEEGLLALLRRPLTDERVKFGLAPFDHPTLYINSHRQPVIVGEGLRGSGGFIPDIISIEPPLLGNDSFTIVIDKALGRSRAYLVIDTVDPAQAYLADPDHYDPSGVAQAALVVGGFAPGEGSASATLNIPRRLSLDGTTMYARWFVEDAGAVHGWAFTPAAQFTLFK